MQYNTTELSLTDIVGEKYDKERSDEVIDSLDVAAGRVAHRPDEQNPLETLLYDLLLEEGDVGIHTGYIDGDLGMGWGVKGKQNVWSGTCMQD
jgi:hypothetical protein